MAMKKKELNWPIFGNDRQIALLKKAVLENSLAHAYLIYGPRGLGKKFITSLLVKSLNCTETDNLPCGQCNACQSVEKKRHPNVFILPRGDSKQIAVDDIREANHFLRLSGTQLGRKKFLIIERVDAMSDGAANALLKSVEEPPAETVIILLAEKINFVPLTIQSRCQLIKLNPLSTEETHSWVKQQPTTADTETIIKLALGRPGRALDMIEDQLTSYHDLIKKSLNILTANYQTKFNNLDLWLKDLKNSSDKIKATDVADETLVLIDHLELVLRDILLHKISPDYLLNGLYGKEIISLSHQYTGAQILKIFKNIKFLRRHLDSAINVQLAWENFMIKIPTKITI